MYNTKFSGCGIKFWVKNILLSQKRLYILHKTNEGDFTISINYKGILVPYGTYDHQALVNRDTAEQHPIAAISGLQETVNKIPAPVEPLTNEDLEEILK